jgi:hypothetical protein
MSFRFNWGTGIFIVIVLFLLSMAAVIYFSMQQRFDLVETGYYPQGLEYQKKIDQKANAGRLSGKITFSQTDGFLNILYPEDFRNQVVKGTVYLFRPSDQNADQTDSIRMDSALVQRIPTGKLLAGRYLAKISWSMNGQDYYYEEGLRIQK